MQLQGLAVKHGHPQVGCRLASSRVTKCHNVEDAVRQCIEPRRDAFVLGESLRLAPPERHSGLGLDGFDFACPSDAREGVKESPR